MSKTPTRTPKPPSAVATVAERIRRAKESLSLALDAIEAGSSGDLTPLDSVGQGIDLLGGTKETAELCGVSMQAVSDWRRDGFFATNTYLLLAPRLEALGYYATPKLWRMKEQTPEGSPVQSSKTPKARN